MHGCTLYRDLGLDLPIRIPGLVSRRVLKMFSIALEKNWET